MWHMLVIVFLQRAQTGTRTQGRCSEDKASVHGRPALPIELIGALVVDSFVKSSL